MRPLYWTRIQLRPGEETKNSLWNDLEETEMEIDEVDSLFSRPGNKPKAKKEHAIAEKRPKKATVTKFFDSKRSQEIGIFIRSNHLDISDVEHTIYNFDNDSSIGPETLVQIQRIRSSVTKDELEAIRALSSSGDDTAGPLDIPEQFVLDLSSISNFSQRLECFMFQTTFADALADIEHRLNNVIHVCDLLTNSQPLRQVLSIILACGNYMNGGTARGQADGFHVDILAKLKDVKSKDNAMTLLQYIVRVWIIKFDESKGMPDAKLPVPEPSDVDHCMNMNFDDQRKECSKLKKDLDNIEMARDVVLEESDEEHLEPFQQKMCEFLKAATVQLNELEDLIENCAMKFKHTMLFYTFRPKEVSLDAAQPKDFFCFWYPFCKDFKNLWKKEQTKVEKEILIQKRQQHEQKRATLRSFKTEPAKPNGFKAKMLRRTAKMLANKNE